MSKTLNNPVDEAKIDWENNEPFSQEYDDVYYSRENGLEESKYVFYDSNDLNDRFTDDSAKNTPVVICETGFGTGLNFLLTWHLWQKLPNTNKRSFHFISIEKHPLTLGDLKKALNAWPSLKKESGELLKQYPYLVAGQHRLSFSNSQVTLTLVFGDVNKDFNDYILSVDCWFLDGFAPSKNVDMWSETLYNRMKLYSKPRASFATFTAASSVRKGLTTAGFQVFKKKGFGRKREMIFGNLSESHSSQTQLYNSHRSKWTLAQPGTTESSLQNNVSYDAVIIGGGLAGLSTAYSLTQKGLRVAIIEKRDNLMSGASGQDQLAMYAKLPTEYNKSYKFIEHSLCHSLRYYKRVQTEVSEINFWNNSGLLQLAWNDKEKEKQSRFIENIRLPYNLIRPITSVEASGKVGINLHNGGLWFDDAGWLSPRAYQEAIKRLCGDKLTLILGKETKSIARTTDSQWNINCHDKTFSCSYLVVCNSNDALKIKELSHLPIKPLRGQVSSLKHGDLKSVSAVICGEGYLCPSVDNWHHIGATFDLDNHIESVFDSDNIKNIANIKRWLPEWGSPDEYEAIRAKAGLRCTTPDYLPVVGLVAKHDEMIAKFSKLRVDANACDQHYGEYYDNLFVNIGHGSKGLFTTPLSADLITSLICKEPLPLNESMRSMLSPARFIIKHLKQRRI